MNLEKKYHGKGNFARALVSAGEKQVMGPVSQGEIGFDKAISIDFKPAATDRQAFKDEYMRMQEDANQYYQEGKDNPINYNKIQSPGKIYCIIDGDCDL